MRQLIKLILSWVVKKINRHSFQAICYKHKIKQDNNSTHHNFTDIHRYSEAFVTWVVKNITEQKGWLESALECYKNRK
ncbi:TPA: hypothetical protein ACGF3T_003510 [Vibrio cholerae]